MTLLEIPAPEKIEFTVSDESEHVLYYSAMYKAHGAQYPTFCALFRLTMERVFDAAYRELVDQEPPFSIDGDWVIYNDVVVRHRLEASTHAFTATCEHFGYTVHS